MKKLLTMLLVAAFLSSCSVKNEVLKLPKIPDMGLNKPTQYTQKKTNTNYSEKTNIEKSVKIEYVPMPYEGGSPWKYESTKESHQKAQKGLKVSVEDMPLNQFVKLVFGDILKVSYFMTVNVENRKDKITLKMTQPMSKEDFMNVVTSVLSKYGVRINEENGVYFIKIGGSEQKKWFIPFYIGRSLPNSLQKESDKLIGLIVPVYYISPNQYTGLIKRLALSPQGDITNTYMGNAFMIVDRPLYLKTALKLIKLFDRPTFSNRIAVLIKLKYLDPSTFVDKLKQLLPLQGIKISDSLNGPGIILKPMDKLGYVFILSPKKSWLNIVDYWKNKLDVISALGESPRMFVFYPNNRRAEDLAKIFYSTAKKGKGFFSNVQMSVDESRNAIVISCTPKEYQKIESVLEKLDTLPKQVFVQVSILEVTLTGELSYGLEWYLRHSGRYNGILQTTGGLGLGSSGLNYSLVTNTSKFMALINAFAKKNRINVLSSPSLVVMDNHAATIDVGTQVPTVTSESTGANIQDNGTTALVRTIQYRNTGVILTIKPTINSNGIVTMDVSQEVSDAQTNNVSKIDSPLILTRSIKTTITLKSGETLLLGGLIKKTKSKTVNKVPILGDIPLLGNLFKVSSWGSTKTELIIEITPYILSDMNTAEKITEKYKSLMDLLNND